MTGRHHRNTHTGNVLEIAAVKCGHGERPVTSRIVAAVVKPSVITSGARMQLAEHGVRVLLAPVALKQFAPGLADPLHAPQEPVDVVHRDW